MVNGDKSNKNNFTEETKNLPRIIIVKRLSKLFSL